jgi:mRNA interferase RelE/StbE
LSYRVFLHPKAAEFLRKADETLRNRIRANLKELESHPEKNGQRLQHTIYYRLRIGDYRAIYLIDQKNVRLGLCS